MDINWKELLNRLLRGVMVLLFLILISFWLSVDLKFALYITIILFLLWRKRDIRLAVLTLGGFLSLLIVLLIFLRWGYGNPSEIFSYLAQGMLVIIVLLLPIFANPWGLSAAKDESDLGHNGSEKIIELAGKPLPPEERQQCPHCKAIISHHASKCSWCGKSL